MMNRARLIQLIQDPGILADHDTNWLGKAVENHPYCQVTQVLFALALYRENEQLFADRLKKAAASVPEREKLKQLFEEIVFTSGEQRIYDQEHVTGYADNEQVVFWTKEDIIEKFIREEPKISRQKGEFYDPNESAVRSNLDEDEIVSETLAQLYNRQGNTARAIKIYEKLILLFPEKNRYFAAQIEKLKE